MSRLDFGQALGLAFAHLDAGRSVEARRLARDLERARPGLPGLAYLMGLLALAEGNGRKAAQHLAKALAQTPDAVPPLLAMARAQVLQGRLDEAEAAYGRLLAAAPDLAEGQEEFAELLLRAGRFQEALQPLSRAVHLRPGWVTALNNLGVAQRAVGDVDGALASFAEAARLAPDFAKAHANLAGILRRLRRAGDALAAAERAVALEPDEAAHWLELAQARRDAGDLEGSLAALREVAVRRPGSAEAAWLAAETLAALGRDEEAVAQYRRVLELDPAYAFGAGLALARLGAAEAPGQAPAAYVRKLFDQYAASFDQDLVGGLNYRGPARLGEAILRCLGRGPYDILDAGCGTGLLAEPLRPLAGRLDGVDLSPRMVDQARARGLYDDLEAAELVAAMNARPGAYDLIAAADVLLYLGDLDPVLAAAGHALRPEGSMAFTVEKAPAGGAGYVLQESGRFAHSEAYLRTTAERHGFSVLLLEETEIRTERGRPVASLVCVLKR